MKIVSPLILALALVTAVGCGRSVKPSPPAVAVSTTKVQNIAELAPLPELSGEAFAADKLTKRVVLIANLSIGCATAPQLADLEQLYQRFRDRGLVILGVPSDDFNPAKLKIPTDKTKQICRKKFGVTFPLLQPQQVTGANKAELYEYLTTTGPESTRGEVDFNLEKFLVGRDGRVRFRFSPFTGALSQELVTAVEQLIQE